MVNPVYKMRNLCEITSSKRIYAADYKLEGVPFYRGKEISEKYRGNLDVSTELFIDRDKFEKIRAKFGAPVAGDLLLTSVGTLGSPYVVNKGEEFYFKDGNLTWFRNFIKLDSQFLYFWLQSPQGKAELKKCTIGSSQSAYTIVLLKEMEISLPPLPTQQKIVSILSAYDDLIENNLRRIKILEEMAHNLYREWFVKFRFPGHQKARFVDSPPGQIPEGWEVVDFSELYMTSSGGTPSRNIAEYYGGSHPWVKTRELNDGFILETEETITTLGLTKSSAKLFPANTVILAIYGATIGKLGILSMPSATNQACVAILPKEVGFGRAFAFLFLRENKDKLIGLGQGAAQQNISQVVLKNFPALRPPVSLMQEFSVMVESLLDNIRNLQQKNTTLRRTRDLLLPRLISGEVDVSELDITVPEEAMA